MEIIVDSNITHLVDLLLADYQKHRQSLGAFGEYTIAVPSKSVENWLTAEIVKRLGICSGIRFESLHTLLNSTLRRGSDSSLGLVDKRQLSAILFKLLSDLLSKRLDQKAAFPVELSVLDHWLQEQNQAQSLAQLCHSLADTFELYQIYRPEWLDAWQHNQSVFSEHPSLINSEQWQSALWRLICFELPDGMLLHRSQLTAAFARIVGERVVGKAEGERSDKNSFAFKGLTQLSIFGVNQLDAETLAQVKLMGKRLPVNIFWQPASLALFTNEENIQLVRDQKAYFSGQELLASLGGVSRQQCLLFADQGLEIDSSNSLGKGIKGFAENYAEGILGDIQKRILLNTSVDGSSGSVTCERLDNSIHISSHFSRYREVEGLHDYLLEQFNQDVSLKPDDIIVLCPDINAYASYVDAVFSNQPSNKIIPFQVSGIQASANDVSSVLMSLIELPQSRYESSRVVDLLNQPLVKARFKLSTEDVEQIQGWLSQANACWGLDKTTLKQLSLPEYDRNTLQSAVDRMVLGLSLDGSAITIDDELLLGIEGMSALQSATLSKLISFIDALSQWRDVCIDDLGEEKSYTPSQWGEHLRALTESCIEVPYKEQDSLNAWFKLLSEFEQSFIDTDLGYSYSFAHLQLNQAVENSAESAFSYRFGRTNIGSFGALKGIPAKVVAILGLNEADFPRKPPADSINLVSKQSKLGDRNQTEQDKDAFLMALLNCRSRLYCSFVGKDMRSNATRMASLVLQELLDQIHHDVEKQAALVVQHPMKAYSDAYFKNTDGLYTFQDFHGHESLSDQLASEPEYSDLPPWKMPETITIQMLKAFLEDPAKAFFKTRFNVDLPDLEADSSDDEPMSESPLTRWKYIDELIQQGLEQGLQQGLEKGELNKQLVAELSLQYRASGEMEHDVFAAKTFQQWQEIAASVLENALIAKGQKQPVLQPVELALNVGGQALTLVGDINVYSDEISFDIIQPVHKKGKEVSEKYLMRAIVDTRIAEALKLEGELNYSSSYLACQDNLYRLSADGQSGANSLQAWLEMYQSVMNKPISLDIVSASKINNKEDYRDAFNQMLEDASSSFSTTRLSKAMTMLGNNDSAVAEGEKFIEHYTYLKPSKTLDEEQLIPQWIEVSAEEGEKA